MKVSIQLVSLARREREGFRQAFPQLKVSIQLVSLARREQMNNSKNSSESSKKVSIQLVSLARREVR